MSDTPITDAVWRKHTGFSPQSAADAYELSGDLERRLSEVTAQRDALAEFARNVAATSSSSRLRREAKAALALVNLEKQKVQFRK